MAPMFIGITGKKFAGKNTLADMIANELAVKHGKAVAITGFANPLKLSVYRLFTGDLEASEAAAVAWVDARKEDWSVDLEPDVPSAEIGTHLSFRKFLQNYGTEAHRDTFEQDFWIQKTMDPFRWAAQDFVLVADVRFNNEAEAIVTGSHRNRLVSIQRDATQVSDKHDSEKGVDLDLIDRHVSNNGDMAQLRGAAQIIAQTVISL